MKSRKFGSQLGAKLTRALILAIFLCSQTIGMNPAWGQASGTTGANSTVGAISGAANNVSGILANFGSTLPSSYQDPRKLILEQEKLQLQSGIMECENGGDGTNSKAANTALAGAASWKAVVESIKKKSDDQAKALGRVPVKADDKTAEACSCPSSELPSFSCDDYFSFEEQEGNNKTRWSASNVQKELLKTNWDIIKSRLDCQKRLVDRTDCPAGAADLEKQYKAFSCMMSKMQKALGNAGATINNVLSTNQQSFSKMIEYERDVNSQITQIEKILGPDEKLSGSGSGEFQGLLGLQKALEQQLQEMGTQEQFQEQVTAINEEEQGHLDTLEGERLQMVTTCLKGDATASATGEALTCSVPVKEKVKRGDTEVEVIKGYTKQTCGPLAYLRSQIEARAMKNSRGQIMTRDNAMKESAQNLASTYDAAIDTMMREFGIYNQPTAKGRNKASSRSWADLEKNNEFMSALAAVEKNVPGLNLVANLKRATNRCSNSTQSWYRQQITSSNSDHNERMRVTKAKRTKLDSELEANLKVLNRSYKNTMSVLGAGAVAVNYSCKNSSADRVACFALVKNNLDHLLNGTGSGVGLTTKMITGGKNLASFQVPCRGVNGCVTALKDIREKQTQHLEVAQKSRTSFVDQGKAQVDKQIEDYAQVVQVGTAAMRDQFAKIQNALRKLGAKDVPESLSMIQGEALEQLEGPDKTAGPYKTPKDIMAVLSGRSGGIPDPSASGLGKAQASGMAAIDAKRATYKEKRDEVAKLFDEFNKVKNAPGANSCTKGMLAAGGGSAPLQSPNSVGQVTDGCPNNFGSSVSFTANHEVQPLQGKSLGFFADVAMALFNQTKGADYTKDKVYVAMTKAEQLSVDRYYGCLTKQKTLRAVEMTNSGPVLKADGSK